MFPFSTIETIREEKNDIIPIAATEKFLKLAGSTATSLNVNGSDCILVVAALNLVTKPRIIVRR